MIKTNLKNVFEVLKRTDISVEKIKVSGKSFDIEQLEVLYNLVSIDHAVLDCIEIEYKYCLSRRKALIVVLEEDFFDKLSYDFTDLKRYENKAALRFKLQNIVKKDLDTPQKVHPKNPCKYFNEEGMGYKKHRYKDALNDILQTPFHFFEVEKAVETLTNTFVKISSADC